MAYINTWESHGLYRKFTGEISGEEILESNFGLHLHANFQKIKYIINDFTEITGLPIQTGHTKVYAMTDNIISKTKGRLKIALVATQEPHIALANNYCEFMKDSLFECDVFQSIEDARKWVSSE